MHVLTIVEFTIMNESNKKKNGKKKLPLPAGYNSGDDGWLW